MKYIEGGATTGITLWLTNITNTQQSQGLATNGNFAIANLQPGQYDISLSQAGYVFFPDIG